MEGNTQQPTDSDATQKSMKGIEIPVPKRRDLMDAFKKIVQPVKKS
jgi:hypothetical protein